MILNMSGKMKMNQKIKNLHETLITILIPMGFEEVFGVYNVFSHKEIGIIDFSNINKMTLESVIIKIFETGKMQGIEEGILKIRNNINTMLKV